ncbi:MAG: hypothetical protein BGO78_05350 [Chloroflexi bacterium 44-23]|nr:MAG: hypothetical protein BGO78_05350 [Chloroflexi bacterium 44-23]
MRTVNTAVEEINLWKSGQNCSDAYITTDVIMADMFFFGKWTIFFIKNKIFPEIPIDLLTQKRGRFGYDKLLALYFLPDRSGLMGLNSP